MVQLSHLYMATGKTITLSRWTFVGFPNLACQQLQTVSVPSWHQPLQGLWISLNSLNVSLCWNSVGAAMVDCICGCNFFLSTHLCSCIVTLQEPGVCGDWAKPEATVQSRLLTYRIVSKINLFWSSLLYSKTNWYKYSNCAFWEWGIHLIQTLYLFPLRTQ